MSDLLRATTWALIPGGGFSTNHHCDAAGQYCEKVSAYQEPNLNPRDDVSASRGYIETAKAYADQWTQKTEDELPKTAFSRSICTVPGTLL